MLQEQRQIIRHLTGKLGLKPKDVEKLECAAKSKFPSVETKNEAGFQDQGENQFVAVTSRCLSPTLSQDSLDMNVTLITDGDHFVSKIQITGDKGDKREQSERSQTKRSTQGT